MYLIFFVCNDILFNDNNNGTVIFLCNTLFSCIWIYFLCNNMLVDNDNNVIIILFLYYFIFMDFFVLFFLIYENILSSCFGFFFLLNYETWFDFCSFLFSRHVMWIRNCLFDFFFIVDCCLIFFIGWEYD